MREATLNDLDFIVDAQLKMAMETEDLKLDLQVVTQGVKAILTDPGKGTYYIGDENKGCLLITKEWSDWRNTHVWWIQSLYVLPEARGEGIFAKMYSDLKKMVSCDAGVAGIRLYVDKTNKHAKKVYQKIGMSNEHYELFEWMNHEQI